MTITRDKGLAGTSSRAASTFSPSAGAERISIGFEPDNPASGSLYRSVGFEPHRRTDVFSGSTLAPGS